MPNPPGFLFLKGVCSMFCKKCGHALYDDCNFCHNCGEKQADKENKEPEPEKKPETSDATLLFAMLVIIAIGFYFLYLTGHIH